MVCFRVDVGNTWPVCIICGLEKLQLPLNVLGEVELHEKNFESLKWYFPFLSSLSSFLNWDQDCWFYSNIQWLGLIYI